MEDTQRNTNDRSGSSKQRHTRLHASGSAEYPLLRNVSPKAVRIFLTQYDQYAREVRERHQQRTFTGDTTTAAEPARPVSLKFCVDPSWLEAAVFMGSITGTEGEKFKNMEELDDDILRAFLERKALANKNTITVPTLDEIIKKQLRMNLRDECPSSRMDNLFINYFIILKRQGCEWVIDEAPKLAVTHVLSKIMPHALRRRISNDLKLAHTDKKRNFNAFRDHCLTLAQAMAVLDCNETNAKKGTDIPQNVSDNSNIESSASPSGTNPKKVTPWEPNCPHPMCKKQTDPKKKRHKIADCPNCKTEEDRQVLYDMVRSRRDGPASNSRSQTNGRRSQTHTSGRLSTAAVITDASIDTILQDENATFSTVTRCDDGSDDCIACPSVAEAAALQGIGRIKKIKTVRIKVALERDGTSPEFTFSRRWCVPDVILNMKAGKLAIRNVSFLICDDRLVSEPVIIGRPVLLHLRVDTNSLLEERIDLLDGTDCAKVENPVLGKGGYVSRLISNRNNNDHPATVRPSVSYNAARLQKDPFPDPALLDLTTDESEHERKTAIVHMVTRAKEAGLSKQYLQKLEQAVQENNAIFQITLPAGPPARLTPLLIKLTPDAKPTRAKLRNYSPSQSDFLKRFVDDLVSKGQAYANPASRWASAPLLVPKAGPSQWRFTVDLRAVNKFTEKSAYPMPNLEHELHKLAKAKCYANFDLWNAYWQLELDLSSQECQ